MSNSKKTKSAVEACREVSKALRSNLDSLKKTEFSPKDAALRILPEVVAQIKAYEEQLVKMRDLEKSEELDKAQELHIPSMGNQTSTPHIAGGGKTHVPNSMAQVKPKPFSMKKAISPIFTAPPKLKAPAMGLGHISHSAQDKTTSADTVSGRMPNAKAEPGLSANPDSSKEMDHKFKLSKVFDVLGKISIMEGNRKQLASKPSDQMLDAWRVKDSVLPSDAAPKEIETPDGNIEKGKELAKKWTLGGKDDASKMATSHAMHAGSTAMNAKINKMPATQLPKMPSAPAHAARQSQLSSFMPKGKFDKSAAPLEKDVTASHTMAAAQSGTPAAVAQKPAPAPSLGAKPTKLLDDPKFDNSYNVTFQSPHGTYTTRGGFGSQGSPEVELHYKANKGKIPGLPASSQKLGSFPNKEQAYAARDQHHDAKTAGIIKGEEEMNKAFDAKGKFITPDKDPKKKFVPGKK